MPVTVHPAPYNDYKPFHYGMYRKPEAPQTPDKLFSDGVRPEISNDAGEIFQTSFDRILPSSRNPSLKLSTPNDSIFASSHSFVRTAVSAYNTHNHLIIRPDDIWLSILAQFNLYINAHAEELRHLFVAHEGKKELEVVFPVGNRYTIDFGQFATRMSHVIEENVTDPELREWIVPDFSTTEDNDRVVASVFLMATLKKYFDYKCCVMCGLPAVTLLGEREDWVEMYEKIDKLKEYGRETTDWCSLLKPVLRHFVLTFDKPESEEVRHFWQKIAHYHGGGSGPTYLSGWINAFCFFSDEGKSLYYSRRTGEPPKEEEMGNNMMGRDERAVLRLDDVLFHQIDSQDIPPGYAEVDVKLDDNGQRFDCKMVAGMVAVKLSDSGMKSSPKMQKMIQGKYYTRELPRSTTQNRKSIADKVAGFFSGGSSGTDKDTQAAATAKMEANLKPGETIVEKLVGIEHDGKKDVVQPLSGWYIYEVQKHESKDQSDPGELYNMRLEGRKRPVRDMADPVVDYSYMDDLDDDDL